MTESRTDLTVPDPHTLLARAIDIGAGIETVERLVSLVRDVRAMQARDAWYVAMARFQQQCPPIRKTNTARIQTARASFSYRYAPLDEVLSVVQPILTPLGLSISWRSPRIDPERVIVICRIAHTLGHVEDSGEVSMPVVLSDPSVGATPPQRVGIALTYARRYSLLAVLGLAPEDDDDANSASENRDVGRSSRAPASSFKSQDSVESLLEEEAALATDRKNMQNLIENEAPILSGPAKPIPERRPRFEFWRTTLANTNSPKGFEAACKRVREVWAQFTVDEQTVLIDTIEAQKRQLGIN
jgi:hypothetical protein